MSSKNEAQDFKSSTGVSFYPDQNVFCDLLTIDEVVLFLRINVVSTSKNYHNVIKNLIRTRDLPHIYISRRLLFPRQKIVEWICSGAGQN